MENILSSWKSISPYELGNACQMIGREWMLVCAGDNAMTASWGGMGVLWNKPVAFVFIRPQRHTYAKIESSSRISLSFFDEKDREALRYFGTHSGRDGDKFVHTGLDREHHPNHDTLFPAQARTVLFCRKVYADDLKKSCFFDSDLLGNYPDDDFHRVYVCQIEEAWTREK